MTVDTALAAFAVLTLVIVGTEIMFTYATQGFGFGFSANRGTPKVSAFATRLKRTLQNHVEAAAYVVPALLAAYVAGLSTPGVQTAALLIVIGRAAFIPLYLSGISFVRVPAFVLATVSSIYLAIMVLAQMG